jgi:hypothetical protein
MKHEHIAFEKIYADPVVILARLFKNSHCLFERPVARKIGDRLLHAADYLIVAGHRRVFSISILD